VFDLDEQATIEHMVSIPKGMCPKSGNPVEGVISLAYTASVAVEVVSLHELISKAQRHSPKTFEGWCLYIGRAVAEAVGQPVKYTAEATVNPGPQTLKVSSCVST